MTGCVLIGLSLSAAAIILTATATPGWLCLDAYLDSPQKTMHIIMDWNLIYSRYCVADNDTCVHAVAFLLYESNSRLSSFGRFKEHFVEGIFTILCTTIGCFLTVAHILSVSRRKQNNSHNLSSTNSKSANGGLFLSIVGGVCGLILMIEFIIINTVFAEMENISFNFRMKKRFPFSIAIICVGILLQVIVVIRFAKLIKSPSNSEDRESILSSSPLVA